MVNIRISGFKLVLCLASTLWAFNATAQIYSESTRQLALPNVQVGAVAFPNVVVRLESFAVLAAGTPVATPPSSTTPQVYSESTRQLALGNVQVGSVWFPNVVVRLDNFAVLAAGAPAPVAIATLEFPGASWKKASADSVGWSSTGLAKADEMARRIRTDAYMVVHKGVMVHEFGATSTASNLHSVRKSLLSVLTGMAVAKGTINLSSSIKDLGIDDINPLTEVEKQATVRQLLQARSGIYHRSAYETPEAAAAHPPRGTFKPGENFNYNNWDFNALGTIFNKTAGKNVFESLRDDLARPLQFEDFSMPLHTRWVFEWALSEHPAYEMQLSARDLARVGLLMARDGAWNGQQLIPSAWVRESTTSYSNAGPGIGYGYMWWVGVDNFHFGQKFPGRVFSGRGNHGQFVVVDADRDLVIVHRVNTSKPGYASLGNAEFNPLLAQILLAGPGLVLPR